MTESSEASSESGGGGGRGHGGGDREGGSAGGDGSMGEKRSPVADAPILSTMTSSIVAVPVVEVPFFVATPGTVEASSASAVGFKFSHQEQVGMSHQVVLSTVTAQTQIQLQAENAHSSVAFKQTTSSPLTPTLREVQYLNSDENIISPKTHQLSTSDKKPQSTHLIVKTTSSDGYNWRKYGQKQVKSSEHSRSYFRCTQANCFAKKKVEHCEDGRVIEIIYRGQHNHEPPLKTNVSKERVSQSSLPERGKKNLHIPRLELNGLDVCTLKADNKCCNEAPEQLHCSSDCERDHGVNTEDDITNEPEPKRRLCENSATYSAPLMKTVKEPKVVVQASFDSGIVNDGYRWRKYGQKIVKGNPNPRSYYKCTNIGCSVRKHVEKALEDTKSVIITYEGKHNHDVPPCKNGNETPTPKLLALPGAEAAITYDEPMEVSSPLLLLDKEVPADCMQNKDGETLAENTQDGTGSGKMALESAEALLSIGCKSSSGDSGNDKTSNSDVIQCPLLDRSCSAVSVQNS